MAKKIIQTLEEITRARLAHDLKKLEEKLAFGMIPLKPTRRFVVNERVRYGSLEEVYIREIHMDGLCYAIECLNVQRERDKPPVNEAHVVEWYELNKYDRQSLPINFGEERKYRITLSNSGISSLLHKVYHAGVDFDVDYQRDLVWTFAEKIALIDSIFNNIDIGKFVFVQRDFGVVGKLYEIIDGKQRLTTLCEFFEDRFQYNSYYYSELSQSDRQMFKNYGITYGYLENPDKKAILDTFIKLNTTGKPMAHQHIDKVKKMLNEIEEGENA